MKWYCRICGDRITEGLYCLYCENDIKTIDRFVEEGHTHHCACRLVWGDGECYCDKSGLSRKEQAERIIEVIKNDIQ